MNMAGMKMNLKPVEYAAQIIMTTEQLAKFYECEPHNITKNYNENKEHFAEGKHYFKLEGEELKKLRITFSDLQISAMTRTLYLWTKRGAARHAKMLGTDKAWEVFEVLEENYFSGRKTSENVQMLKPSAIVDEIGLARDSIKNVFKVKEGIALAKAMTLVEEYIGKELTQLKQLIPAAEHETGFMNATQLGEKLGGFTAREVNKILEEADMQYRDGRDWRLTEEGAEYGEEMPYTKNGHSGYQIRWSEKILEELPKAIMEVC